MTQSEEQEDQKTKDYLEFAVWMLWFTAIGVITYVMGDYQTFNMVAPFFTTAVAIFYTIEAKWRGKK